MTDVKNLDQIKEQRAIEINFPLRDIDLLKILKGTEFNLIKHLPDGKKIHIKIFSPDKVKHISYENWCHLVAASWSNPELQKIIEFIETSQEIYHF